MPTYRRMAFPFQHRPFLRLTTIVLLVTGSFSSAAALKWHHSYSEALAEAKQTRKPIFLAFR